MWRGLDAFALPESPSFVFLTGTRPHQVRVPRVLALPSAHKGKHSAKMHLRWTDPVRMTTPDKPGIRAKLGRGWWHESIGSNNIK